MSPLRISYRELSRQLVPGEHGIEVRITSEFAIDLGGESLYADDMFPVAEFAMASQVWAAQPDEPFHFGDLAFLPDGGLWSVADHRLNLDVLLGGLDLFYVQLREGLQTAYGFDLEALFQRGDRIPRGKLQ